MDSSGERLWARSRRRASRLPLVLPLAGALVLLSVSGSTAADPTVEAAGGASGYYWNPAQASTTPGGSVSFRSSNPGVPHGVTWTGGPATPTCSGVPIDDGKTGWSGTCSFAQAGDYAFVCYVHPVEMKGTIAVGSGGSGPPPPPPPDPSGGPAAGKLEMSKRQRGGSVRGSVELQEPGKLVVELFGSRSQLGLGKSGKARVGRIARSSSSGPLGFAVPLKRPARRALARSGSLSLTARITVVAQGSETFTRTRRVVISKGADS